MSIGAMVKALYDKEFLGDGKLNGLYYVQANAYDSSNYKLNFDLSFIDGYQKLSVDDIYYATKVDHRGTKSDTGGSGTLRTIVKSYDKTTGIFTLTFSGAAYDSDDGTRRIHYFIIIEPQRLQTFTITCNGSGMSKLTFNLTDFLAAHNIDPASFSVNRVFVELSGLYYTTSTGDGIINCRYSFDASTCVLTVQDYRPLLGGTGKVTATVMYL